MADVASDVQRAKDPEWLLRLGKFMFYVTCAFAVWFFYWFNAIQCPC
jgi:hypothetical protein